MQNINFEEYLEYMYNRSGESDSYWLADWIENTTGEYLLEFPCETCGSKIKEVKDIWSKTRNHVLEEQTICSKCGFVIGTKDRRDNIRRALKEGQVKVKDVAVLKEELDM